MKITAFIILILSLQVYAKSFAQTEKINLSMNSTIKEVIEQLEKVSDYRFVLKYDESILDKQVSVKYANESIEKILDDLLKDTGFTYSIVDRYIAIRPVDKTTVNEQQEKSVSGKVTDSSGESLPGVSVVIKGTSQGIITDVDGKYTLNNVPANAILQFSFVGMKTQDISVEGKSTINVSLQEESIGIEEVVAVGYGVQKKVNLTGAVVSIPSEELNKRPVANAAQMLQGKLAGVNVSQNSAEPGSEGISINIRGMNSFGTKNEPLVLIDGVVGSLSDVDPLNIESVSVLKDAASAAIYGSRASNGVILVTTKHGKAGEFSLSYSGNLAIQKATRLPELINDPVEFMQMYNKAATNSGVGWKFTDEMINRYKPGGDLKGFDWDKAVFKDALVQKHNLMATGGTQKIRYNVGLGYWDQNGVVIGFNYKKYNALFNVDSDITDKITIGASVNLNHGLRKGTAFGQTDMILATYNSLPIYPPKLDDGRPVRGAFYGEQHNKNPITVAENGGAWTKENNILAKFYITFAPFKGFKWTTNGSVKYDNYYKKTQIPVVDEYWYSTKQYGGGLNDVSVVSLDVNQQTNMLNTLYSTVSYKKEIGKHNLEAMAGYSQESFRFDELKGFRKNFPNNMLTELNAGGTNGQTTGGYGIEWALQSLFGRINYDYNGKYLFELNFRRDGSSRFEKSRRNGIFPSVSAGWRISEETFAKNLSWLSNLKLRASWGKLGNQTIGTRNNADYPYPYQNLMALGYNYPFADALMPGTVLEALANNAITWETTKITDAGLDVDIQNGLLSASFDYFDKTTTNILRRSQVMGHVGLDAPYVNDGAMRNSGFDLNLGHRHSLGKLKYEVNFNLSHYNNKLTKFGAPEIGDKTKKEEGRPWDSWYLYEFDGIFQSNDDIKSSPKHFYTPRPGDIKLKDQNGDKVIDEKDRVVIAGRYPKYSYSFNLNLAWKNFDLTMFLQGLQGIKRYVSSWGIEPFVGGSRPPVKWRDAWTADNKSNSLPAVYFGLADTNNRQKSTFYLQDASYLRLKTLQIGYNLPNRFISKVGIANARIYLSGDNLITWTKFEGADPERDDSENFATYPQSSAYSLGIIVKF